MAGIYIHIPFCRKACHYCDFHFSTSLTYKNELILNLLKEIDLRSDYLAGESVDTIYIGGGTPSLLSETELSSLLERIHQRFTVHPLAECTLEANPDDLDKKKISEIKRSGVNRLSIGIQSFFDEDLLYMNRSHNGQEAANCIANIQEGGIDDFSIDLIFGYPLLTNEKWEQNIQKALSFNVPHLSCYAMTVEPKTALASFIANHKALPMNQEQSAFQFEYLMKILEGNGYEHYEISNYAKPGKRAIHNSNYWKGVSYLGLGPSAHSFNGESRQWNVANNAQYIKALSENRIPFEQEILTTNQKLNERILTTLRTSEGLSYTYVVNQLLKDELEEWTHHISRFEHEGMIMKLDDQIILTKKGKLFADHIAGELFV